MQKKFSDLKYKLRTQKQAHQYFKEIVVPRLEIHLGTSKVGRNSVEKVVEEVIDKLELEMSEGSKYDSGSRDICSIVNQVYSNISLGNFGVDLHCSKSVKNIDSIHITQPGIDSWKMLRLAYLQEKDYIDLLNKDSPQLLMHFLVEGNTRILFSYMNGQQDLPVNVISLRGNSDLRRDIRTQYANLTRLIQKEYGHSDVRSLQSFLFGDIMRKYKKR